MRSMQIYTRAEPGARAATKYISWSITINNNTNNNNVTTTTAYPP